MPSPLPIRDGLNPTRVQVPPEWATAAGQQPQRTAEDFVWHLVSTQRHRAPDDDQSAVRSRFASGDVVRDDGSRLDPADPLRAGEFINFYRRPAPERPVPGELRVIFQDDNITVVDKPAFLATLPRGQHITQTALTRARVELGNPLLAPAHRLDRLTRGVLLFTNRPEVRGAYQTLFDRRVPRKIYEAVTPLPQNAPYDPLPKFANWHSWAPPTPADPWVLAHHMVKQQGRLTTYLTDATPNSITHVTALTQSQDEGSGQPVLRWLLEPKTGRTHQLRVALRSLGLPLLNDSLYNHVSDAVLCGADGPYPSPAFVEDEDFTSPLGLIARQLEFTDPLSGKQRCFRSLF